MVIALIFFATLLCLLATCTKGAARILRYSGVTWKQGFAYAGVTLAASLLVRLVLTLLNVSFDGYSAIPVALLFQVSLGAWFFRRRVLSEDGAVVGMGGAAKLSAVAFGFWCLTALAFFLISNIVNHQ